MTDHQQTAITHHCRLAFETAHPRYGYLVPGGIASIVLTVNSGYEWLDENYGGPVWHASAAPIRGEKLKLARLKALAFGALLGVGNASLGEWMEWTGYAFHVRRRLSRSEEAIVGPVRDLRRTEEGLERLQSMRHCLPQRAIALAFEELGVTLDVHP